MSSRGKFKKEHPRTLARQTQPRVPVYIRKFARSIARHEMEVAGIRNINRKYNKRNEKDGAAAKSAFARRWRMQAAQPAQAQTDARRKMQAARRAKKA